MSDVEKLVAFNSIRGYLNDEQQQRLLNDLSLNSSNLTPRIRGLNVEAEFFVILSLLKSCKHILSFDEGTSVLTKSNSPDCLLVLNNNEKLFVEIKSKDKFIYSISGGNLQKKVDFAKEFVYKLYFAVKLGGFWGLYASDFLQSKNGKLSFPHDYNNSEFEEHFGSNLLIFPEGIKVESFYSPDKVALSGIRHETLGNLFLYKFYFKEKLIFEANELNDDCAIYSMVLEKLHDAMSVQSQEIKEIENNTTIITEKLTTNIFLYDYHFLLGFIYHTETELGYKYDTTTYYKSILENEGKALITKEILMGVISFLQWNGTPIIVSSLKKEKAIVELSNKENDITNFTKT